MKLEEKLVYLRKRKGMTQLELAEALRVSRQAISKWESGAAMPSTDNLLYLSKLYEVPANDLVDHEVELTDRIAETEGKTFESEIGAKNRESKKYFAAAVLVLITILLTILAYRGLTREDSQTLSFDEMESESWDVLGTDKVALDTEW